MTPDQEIERLSQQLRELHTNHPNAHAVLRTTRTAFRACTQQRWQDHNYTVKDHEAGAIMNGTDAQREAALLSLLKPQNVCRIEFVPGVDIIDVVPAEATLDQV